jgi:hypothetical protein
MNFRRFVVILVFIGISANPMAEILLSTDFPPPDGPVIETPDALWKHHSGASGELQIEDGQLHLNQDQTEDVHAPLNGGPWDGDKAEFLYAGFSIRCDAGPGKTGGYFAHWMDTKNGHRCRLFAAATEAVEGCYRLGIANGTAGADTFASIELPLNAKARIVLRYSLKDAQSTLWINPDAEQDNSFAAQDSVAANPIASLAFRQAAGIGSLWIDDVSVGTRFAEVLSDVQPPDGVPMITQQPQSLCVAEGAPAELSVSAQSPDAALFQWIWNGGNLADETNATLRIAAAAKAHEGSYWVLVSNSSGSIQSLKAVLTVTNAAGVGSPILLERFEHENGPLCEVSSGAWRRHSGASNEIAVSQGAIRLSEQLSEDINLPIPGSPFPTNACLYAGFALVCEVLPSGPDGGYFAHFKDGGNGYRCRVFACTNGAAAGCWRLGVSGAANAASACLAEDLLLEHSYRVVMRLDLGTGESALWVDPHSENDPAAVSTDSGKSIGASAFAFRQSLSGGNGMGVLRVDDLAIGRSLQSVLLGPHETTAISLSISCRIGGQVELNWTADPSRTYSVWACDLMGSAFSLRQGGLAFPDGAGLFVEQMPDGNPLGFYRVSTP